ncbi:spore germination protein [Paenibacillus rhizoplanae]
MKNKHSALNSEAAGTLSAHPPLSPSLEETVGRLRKIFNNDGTLRVRIMENSQGAPVRCGLIYVDGMVDRNLIQTGIIKPILAYQPAEEEHRDPKVLMERIRLTVIDTPDVMVSEELDGLIGAVVSGKAVLLLEGYAGGLIINVQGWDSRAIEEPTTEKKQCAAPREGFTESLLVNLTLIRRRVRDPDLKIEFTEIGTRSKTQTCICYMGSLASPDIIKELYDRLEKVELDLILDTGYLAELIRDEPYSPFETVGSTERPDTLVSKNHGGAGCASHRRHPFCADSSLCIR